MSPCWARTSAESEYCECYAQWTGYPMLKQREKLASSKLCLAPRVLKYPSSNATSSVVINAQQFHEEIARKYETYANSHRRPQWSQWPEMTPINKQMIDIWEPVHTQWDTLYCTIDYNIVAYCSVLYPLSTMNLFFGVVVKYIEFYFIVPGIVTVLYSIVHCIHCKLFIL